MLFDKLKFGKNKKEDLASRYEDPSGSFGSGELKAATWYVKNKLLLQKIGIGALAVFCIITVGYSLFGWGKYLIFDYFSDRDMLTKQTLELNDYQSLHALYGAQQLQLGNAEVFTSSNGQYDFVTTVQNPNNRWAARVKFKYIYNGGETESEEAIILPLQERPFVVFAHEESSYPTRARLVIENIEWRSIDAHMVPNVSDYINQRFIFITDNFEFTRAGGSLDLPASSIKFDLTNDTAYSYWEAEFYVELLNSGNRTGVLYLAVPEFRAGETRTIDLRSFSEGIDVDAILLNPIINVFDSSEYIQPGK
ncbi:MAG: hypothetical protein GF349_01160 [Candidatus Magasanikbacteria bacterium]|nr:hypothetical protein [Candidatus Magasanikbacteria bacterium]